MATSNELSLAEMAKALSELNREHIVSKLEDLCTMLKSAVTDFNLKVPPLVSFERYLHKIDPENIKDVFYVMDMIHQCWLYLNPSFLFDRPMKSHMDVKEMIGKALNKYNGPNPDPNYDFINQEVDRQNITVLTLLAAKAYNKLDARYKNAYGKYMDGLYAICKSVCLGFDIKLDEDFTINYVLTSNLTRSQIESVYNAVANDGKMNNDQDTKTTFLSIFDSTISAVEHQILWLDVAKSRKPNYASLYVMFKTMGLKMTAFERTVICKVFTTPQGPIDPDQLKSRETNNSNVLKTFEALIRKAL